MTEFFVVVEGRRPDWRAFLTLAYGAEADVDTDGDAIPVHTRNWTWLYMRLRQRGACRLEMELVDEDEDPRLWRVRSMDESLAEVVALYLLETCGSEIALGGARIGPDALAAGRRRHAEALSRARGSIWHRSSERQPYPNLSDGGTTR